MLHTSPTERETLCTTFVELGLMLIDYFIETCEQAYHSYIYTFRLSQATFKDGVI